MVSPYIDSMVLYDFVSECSDYFFRCLRVCSLHKRYAKTFSSLVTTSQNFTPYNVEASDFYLKYAPNNGVIETAVNAYYNYIASGLLTEEVAQISISFCNAFLSHMDNELWDNISKHKIKRRGLMRIENASGIPIKRAVPLYVICKDFLSDSATIVFRYGQFNQLAAAKINEILSIAPIGPGAYLPKQYETDVLMPRQATENAIIGKICNTSGGVKETDISDYLQVGNKAEVISKLQNLPFNLPPKIYGAVITVMINKGIMRPIADGERSAIYHALCRLYTDGRNIGTRQAVTKYICKEPLSDLDIASAEDFLR